MVRRIAAVLLVGAVLLLAPERLGGVPSTSTRSTTSSTVSTTTAPPPTTPPPNPLRVFPRRPGAKYDDIEARSGGSVQLGGRVSVGSWTVEPRNALPARWKPASTKTYRDDGLVDGYTPVATDTTGAVLHVVMHESKSILPAPLTCTATVASDGTVLVPYTRHPAALPPEQSKSHTFAAFDINLYFPLGAHHGRIYIGCRGGLAFLFSGLDETRAVWAIDA